MALAPGDPAPPLVARFLSGDRFEAKWQSNRLTLVNFWATWCEPCRWEMPALESLSRKYSKKKVAVVGVLIDPAKDEDVRKFTENAGVSYPIVRGDLDVSNTWGGIGTIPTTFLVNAQGRIARRYVGTTPEQLDAIRTDLEALLAGRPLGKLPEPPAPRSEPSKP